MKISCLSQTLKKYKLGWQHPKVAKHKKIMGEQTDKVSFRVDSDYMKFERCFALNMSLSIVTWLTDKLIK